MKEPLWEQGPWFSRQVELQGRNWHTQPRPKLEVEAIGVYLVFDASKATFYDIVKPHNTSYTSSTNSENNSEEVNDKHLPLGAATPASQQRQSKPAAPNVRDKATDGQFGEGAAWRMLAHAVLPTSSNRLMLSYPSRPASPNRHPHARVRRFRCQLQHINWPILNVANQPYTTAAEYCADVLQE
jgi:hypothetical protein